MFKRPLILAAVPFILAGCDSASRTQATATVPENAPSAPRAAAVENATVSLPAEISFNEHIQPILSEYCYHCHGPDSKTREPKKTPLRLDRVEDAFAPREDGKPVIIKGKPGESLLIELIRSQDPDVIMPPPKSHKTMNEREIALLERWIEQGAEYEAHWSFAPIEKPEVPAAGETWTANPIDRFIAAKLDESGLKPNPPEEPRRFHRRLALDLTGLPPEPAETDAFVKALATNAQAAIEAEADRLLATSASAEHFARHWLDAARYADTHGIHIDNYRAIWPYRDWVVRAFQQNMPWDQFTLEQIAGDLLPDRTLDQQVATGFSRCLSTTGEGGAIGEEYEAIYAKDRVDTVSAVWLGLTTGCASCHDHKFDPVTMKEFYQLAAFFRNTPMSALDGNNAEHKPSIFVPLTEDRARWDLIAGEIAAVEKQLAERKAKSRPDFDAWLANASIAPGRQIDSTLSLHLPLAETDGPLRGTVDGQPREWPVDLPRIDGPLGKAAVISETPADLGDVASFSRGDRVSYGGFIRIEGKPTGAIVARMNPAQMFRGWDLWIDAGRPGSHVIDSWDKAASKTTANEALKPREWHHVMVTFDGTISGHQVHTIYVNGKRVRASTDPNTVGGSIETTVPLRLGSREGGESKIQSGKVAMQDFRFYRRLLTPQEISALASTALLSHVVSIPLEQRTKAQLDSLHEYFIANIDQPSRDLAAKLDPLRSEQSAIRNRGSVSLVMEEKKEEPYAHVLNRGVYSDKGEKVPPGTPAVLPPMPKDSPNNRLGLARWLNDPANPLPARVTMNRAWYYLFGTGIVETNDDFGIMGARPSHPQLLDWLAAEFIASKWNHRHMIKLMVSSAAYRQSGAVTPEKLEKDPSNRLLARGPRVRLDAEPIRDLVLAASGMLSRKVGGPPVKPYQPEGIWEAVAMPQSNTRHYRQDSGESLYRRSLYTIWKRTAAPPTMEIFNAPTRETFCVRRDRTNTPLQALALLNDPQFVEASRVLAARTLKESSEFDSRLDHITLRLISRTLAPDERSIVRKSLDEVTANFRKQPDEAAKLLATGEAPSPQEGDPQELAAWTVICSQILNLDETITR
jgi:Protein of unknown function (DUF1553)/Protein of unknown function (DUF1549)/Concanavalin A-like lectin/glucanases superfamily/Planctomycete cytochrome C